MFSMLRPVTATFRPQACGGVDDLLDAVDIAGEGGDDNALFAAGELPDKGLAHGALAHGVARALHIGGVRQQGQDALRDPERRSGPGR